MKMSGTVPVLEGGVDSHPRWAGPEVGEHTGEVLIDDLGLSAAKLGEGNVIGRCYAGCGERYPMYVSILAIDHESE